MNSPCNNCNKALIDKSTILKCDKPCNKGKQWYNCEKQLIDVLSGKSVLDVMKGNGYGKINNKR